MSSDRLISQQEGLSQNSVGNRSLLEALKQGYAVIPFLEEDALQNSVSGMEQFFSREGDYQNQFIVNGEIEIGYNSLPEKQTYSIRNQELPLLRHLLMIMVLQRQQNNGCKTNGLAEPPSMGAIDCEDQVSVNAYS